MPTPDTELSELHTNLDYLARVYEGKYDSSEADYRLRQVVSAIAMLADRIEAIEEAARLRTTTK